MLIIICRLYDSYSDAHRVVLMLASAGLSPSETSVTSKNSDIWYSAPKTTNVVLMRKDNASRESDGKVEGAAIGAAIGVTVATAASFVTVLAIPGVGAAVGAGWLAAMLDSTAIGGGRLAGCANRCRHPRGEYAGVCREAMMNQSAVNPEERRDLYRKSGWQSFDPNAVPYTADQVRSERAPYWARGPAA